MRAPLEFVIRSARSADIPVLADVYRAAILEVGNRHYTPEQVSAWASFPDDLEVFGEWITRATTLVALDSDGVCLGFGGLETPARISSLFTEPARMRSGIGSTILERLIATADSRGIHELTTQASEYSKPLFERFGFTVDHLEHTNFKGVAFTRYVMRRPPP